METTLKAIYIALQIAQLQFLAVALLVKRDIAR